MSAEKIAIVTEAWTGIGRAVSLALLQHGYSVALTGRRVDKLEETAAQAKLQDGRTIVIPADVRRPDQVKSLFSKTLTTFGRLDLLFNNAGLGTAAVHWKNFLSNSGTTR